MFFFIWWRRRGEDDDDEDFFDLGGKEKSDFDSMAPNPFVTGGATAGAGHAHNNSNTTRSYSTTNDENFMFDNGTNVAEPADPLHPNEEFGRRRLSNGSLPDMVTRNPGSLKVVNY